MSDTIILNVKKQSLVMTPEGYRQWQSETSERILPPQKIALVLCDVWDHHWCRGAEERLALLLPRMHAVVKTARQRGVLIIHAPSETMEHYRHSPARQRILALPEVQPPPDLPVVAPALPVDAADGGCDTVANSGGVDEQLWTRQHEGIDIDPGLDFITDKGHEVYNLIQHRGLQQLVIMGVHTNMCILNRSFAIKQIVRWGQPVALMRDLTDAMYNPASSPYVDHATGTQLVIDYIEKYWCPTVCSSDFLS